MPLPELYVVKDWEQRDRPKLGQLTQANLNPDDFLYLDTTTKLFHVAPAYAIALKVYADGQRFFPQLTNLQIRNLTSHWYSHAAGIMVPITHALRGEMPSAEVSAQTENMTRLFLNDPHRTGLGVIRHVANHPEEDRVWNNSAYKDIISEIVGLGAQRYQKYAEVIFK